jgi:hypothetical protein
LRKGPYLSVLTPHVVVLPHIRCPVRVPRGDNINLVRVEDFRDVGVGAIAYTRTGSIGIRCGCEIEERGGEGVKRK